MPASPAVPRVALITRSEWGAAAPRKSAGAVGSARQITVHHTAQGYSYASKPDVSEADGEKAVRAVQASHFQRGFSDVGYHFLVDGAGRRYQGRSYVTGGSFGPGHTPPVLALGSHVKGHNTANIGVNVLGCFGGKGERGCDDTPSEAAVDSLVQMLTALCLAYNVPPRNIVGHRDLAANVCPGDRLYARLGQIRAAVASAVGHAR